VRQQPHLFLGVVLGEALFGNAGRNAEVLRQALEVARRHFDRRVAATVGRALRARVLRAHRDGKGFAIWFHAKKLYASAAEFITLTLSHVGFVSCL
jgi:hypothetical protein